jgi:uncharacterized protein involved in outer membrane biogenesis
MKLFKRILLAAVALVVIAVVVIYLSLNSIIRAGVERQATASLNVQTTLGSAALSLFGGSLSLGDLEIASPQNYSAPHTMTLGGASATVSYGQLTGSPIHIAKISVDNPVVFVEQNNLKLNLQALMDGIPQTPKTSGGQPTEPTKLIIDELDLTNAQVNFMPNLPGMNSEISIPIPSLTLKNIGNADGNQNGVAIKDVVMQVLTALAAKAGDSANLPPELKTLLSGGLGNISQQLGTQFNQQIQGLGGNLGNVLNNKSNGNSNNGVGSAINGLFNNSQKQP